MWLACCRILKYCLRGMLGDKGKLFYFLDTLSLACSNGVSVALADSVEERLHKSLALIERNFPMSVQVYIQFRTCLVIFFPRIQVLLDTTGHNNTRSAPRC